MRHVHGIAYLGTSIVGGLVAHDGDGVAYLQSLFLNHALLGIACGTIAGKDTVYKYVVAIGILQGQVTIGGVGNVCDCTGELLVYVGSILLGQELSHTNLGSGGVLLQ